jgi:hypothetical protein
MASVTSPSKSRSAPSSTRRSVPASRGFCNDDPLCIDWRWRNRPALSAFPRRCRRTFRSARVCPVSTLADPCAVAGLVRRIACDMSAAFKPSDTLRWKQCGHEHGNQPLCPSRSALRIGRDNDVVFAWLVARPEAAVEHKGAIRAHRRSQQFRHDGSQRDSHDTRMVRRAMPWSRRKRRRTTIETGVGGSVTVPVTRTHARLSVAEACDRRSAQGKGRPAPEAV